MNIYVASSWRNPWQPGVVRLLRGLGHEVYDFREPKPGAKGFGWSEVDRDWREWSPRVYRESLGHPVAEQGFANDFNAMVWAEAFVLVLPCGSSAHLELGWACGAGKRTAVLFPFGIDLPISSELGTEARLRTIEPELMVKMADAILINAGELRDWVGRVGAS